MPWISGGIFPPLASIAADQKISIWQDIGYQTVGMLIVVGALGIIALLLTVIGRLFIAADAKAAARAVSSAGGTDRSAVPQAVPVSSAPASDAPTPEQRAAIVAAVHYYLGTRARVLEIHTAHPELAVWSLEGRRQIFLSHRVR